MDIITIIVGIIILIIFLSLMCKALIILGFVSPVIIAVFVTYYVMTTGHDNIAVIVFIIIILGGYKYIDKILGILAFFIEPICKYFIDAII